MSLFHFHRQKRRPPTYLSFDSDGHKWRFVSDGSHRANDIGQWHDTIDVQRQLIRLAAEMREKIARAGRKP